MIKRFLFYENRIMKHVKIVLKGVKEIRKSN
jgi:hypothetical protein